MIEICRKCKEPYVLNEERYSPGERVERVCLGCGQVIVFNIPQAEPTIPASAPQPQQAEPTIPASAPQPQQAEPVAPPPVSQPQQAEPVTPPPVAPASSQWAGLGKYLAIAGILLVLIVLLLVNDRKDGGSKTTGQAEPVEQRAEGSGTTEESSSSSSSSTKHNYRVVSSDPSLVDGYSDILVEFLEKDMRVNDYYGIVELTEMLFFPVDYYGKTIANDYDFVQAYGEGAAPILSKSMEIDYIQQEGPYTYTVYRWIDITTEKRHRRDYIAETFVFHKTGPIQSIRRR